MQHAWNRHQVTIVAGSMLTGFANQGLDCHHQPAQPTDAFFLTNVAPLRRETFQQYKIYYQDTLLQQRSHRPNANFLTFCAKFIYFQLSALTLIQTPDRLWIPVCICFCFVCVTPKQFLMFPTYPCVTSVTVYCALFSFGGRAVA